MLDKTHIEREKFKRFLKENSVAILNSYFNTEKRVGCYGFEITPDGYIADCLGYETRRSYVSFVYRHSGTTVTHRESITYEVLDNIISKLKREINLKVLLNE